MKARLASLRDRAQRKRVPFDLDLDWLADFLKRTGYDSTLHHIDRVCVLGGYTKGNLQVLTVAQNVGKGNRERRGQGEMF